MTTFDVPRDEAKAEPCCKPPSGPIYPTIEFSRKHVEILKQMLGGKLPSVGDELEGTVVLVVKSVSEGPEEWDNRICMNLKSMDGIGSMEIEKEDDDEDEAEMKKA